MFYNLYFYVLFLDYPNALHLRIFFGLCICLVLGLDLVTISDFVGFNEISFINQK